MVKITIEANAKEIADLVCAVQGQHETNVEELSERITSILRSAAASVHIPE